MGRCESNTEELKRRIDAISDAKANPSSSSREIGGGLVSRDSDKRVIEEWKRKVEAMKPRTLAPHYAKPPPPTPWDSQDKRNELANQMAM